MKKEELLKAKTFDELLDIKYGKIGTKKSYIALKTVKKIFNPLFLKFSPPVLAAGLS